MARIHGAPRGAWWLASGLALAALAAGCDRPPAGATPPAGAPPAEAPAKSPATGRANDVPPMPARFGVTVVRMAASGEGRVLRLSPEDGETVQAQAGAGPLETRARLAPEQRAALWRLLHASGLDRFPGAARADADLLVLEVTPGRQVAYAVADAPPEFLALVAEVEAALGAAGPAGGPPPPASFALFVAAAPEDRGHDGLPVGASSEFGQGTWLEPDGLVAHDDRRGLRLAGLLPADRRAALWALLRASGLDDLPRGDPGDPVVLSVWVDGRERRYTGVAVPPPGPDEAPADGPGAAPPALLDLATRVRAHLATGLAPLPPAPDAPPRPADFSFALGRGGGAAASWDELAVAPDGAVERRRRGSPPEPAGRVALEALDAAWRDVHRFGFFALDSRPGNMSEGITVTADGRTHAVAFWEGQGPVRFRLLRAALRAHLP